MSIPTLITQSQQSVDIILYKESRPTETGQFSAQLFNGLFHMLCIFGIQANGLACRRRIFGVAKNSIIVNRKSVEVSDVQ